MLGKQSELFFGSYLWDYGAILYLISHACVWSWMEVEMEGKHGWAVNLPTSCAFAHGPVALAPVCNAQPFGTSSATGLGTFVLGEEVMV